MTRTTPRIMIDARPRGPAGTLAETRVQGTTVLARLVAQSVALGAGTPLVHAAPEDAPRLRGLLANAADCEWIAEPAPGAGDCRKTAGDCPNFAQSSEQNGTVPLPESRFATVPGDAVTLRTDRIYDHARLRRALRRGRDPESAVIWRLDTPEGLAGAEQELARRQSYQPLGRYWALAPARALARALRPTVVRPNALTLAAGCLMLGAAGSVAFAPRTAGVHVVNSVVLALALVLDTADGHLARLQGTASEFGRWLDAYLDELADMALHAAIAWEAFARDGHAGWLLLGMLYAMGKYQFVVATAGGAGDTPASTRAAETELCARSNWRTRAVACVRLAGHADIRWHLWIVLAALGRLDAALAAYAVYFPARALAVAVRRGVRRG